MPTFKKRKTDRASFTQADLEAAIKEVSSKQLSIRKAAQKYSVNRSTLQRYAKQFSTEGKVQKKSMITTQVYPYWVVIYPDIALIARQLFFPQVFSSKEEDNLKEHIVNMSKVFYGLSKVQVRRVAYEFAVAKGKNIPTSWKKNEAAGEDWLLGFRKRTKSLSLRKPESTSLARAMAFNKESVGLFFRKLHDLGERLSIEPHKIWNLDETGINTVVASKHVFCQTGCKQIGQIKSSERGENVTMCACINAVGQSLPPVFIFPRVHFKSHMMIGAPPGSLGLANPSGWMKNELFPTVLQHFQKFMNVSRESPGILILDNHSSHLSIESIEFSRDNGINLLTFPPHCSHRMQPLDVSVFGPFKRYYAEFSDSWHRNNPGMPLTIYHVADLASKALVKSFTPENVLSGFRCTGIFPYNHEIFTEDQYLPSVVTDIALPSAGEIQCTSEGISSSRECEQTLSQSNEDILASISPIPKAKERCRSKRKKLKSAIITDTPEKNRLHPKHKGKIRLQENENDSSSPDSEMNILVLTNDSEDESTGESECSNEVTQELLVPSRGQFVLARVYNDKNSKLYIGKINSEIDADGDFEVTFLQRSSKIKNGFVFPDVEDIASVPQDHIEKILPEPKNISKTKRLSNVFKFPVNLFNVA